MALAGRLWLDDDLHAFARFGHHAEIPRVRTVTSSRHNSFIGTPRGSLVACSVANGSECNDLREMIGGAWLRHSLHREGYGWLQGPVMRSLPCGHNGARVPGLVLMPVPERATGD